jgi:hypothetical protein
MNSRFRLVHIIATCAIFAVLVIFVRETNALSAAPTETISFSGYEWQVRSGNGGPGPNVWDENNVWVDQDGYLHLTIAYRNEQWTTAEVTMTERLGFGKYQFQVIGEIDKLDKNVVLGLFNYPPPDVGVDGTNEIDIEFARWGNDAYPNGNFTVFPRKAGLNAKSRSYEFALDGTYTTHRFTWSSQSILFQSLYGHRKIKSNKYEFAHWNFQPKKFLNRIPRDPMPVHMNLWLFQGQAPTDGQPVEIIIRKFTFKPE